MFVLLFGWFVCMPDVLGKAKLCFLIQTADIAETFCAFLRFSAGMGADREGMYGAERGGERRDRRRAGARLGNKIPTRHNGFPKPGTEIPKSGTEIPKPGTEIPKPGTGIPKPGTANPKPGTEISKPGTEKRKPGTEWSVPGFGDRGCRSGGGATSCSWRGPA